MFLIHTVQCENPRHTQQHLRTYLKKYPMADKNATYATIDVDPNFHWVANLEHEDRNSAELSSVFHSRGYQMV